MSGGLQDHAAEARAALNVIVSDPGLGAATLTSATMMAGLLQDLLPDAPRERALLRAAAEHGVATILQERTAAGLDVRTATRLAAASFAEATAFTPEAGEWAVREFAIALGLVPPSEADQPGAGHEATVTAGRDAPPDRSGRRWLGAAVGIDLGAANSVVAVLEGGKPVVIASAEGARTMPSVVAFAKSGGVLTGEAAARQAVTNVDRTIRSVKRQMGTDWTVSVDGKKFTAQQISAFILLKLKRAAEAHLGETVTNALITVPVYFSDRQRQATKQAGQIAGLNVVRIVSEPTAAALAYHLDRRTEATVAVFDLGAGSLSISLLEVGEGVVEVKAASGDIRLGGDDWSDRLAGYLAEVFRSQHGVDLSRDPSAMARLAAAAEAAKIELSAAGETTVQLPYLATGPLGPLHLDARLTRAEFQQMTSDLLERCKGPFQQVIKDAEIPLDRIDHVVLVGGSTRMPAVVDLVKDLTGGEEPNKGVNPDEVVAVGAALQAGVLKGEIKDVLLLDATPLSLGIETKGGIFTMIIERNTSIPTKRSEKFTVTADDSRSSVRLQVYEGEREIAADNRKLGVLELAGINPAPDGTVQVEVTFDIDADGIVIVSAKDLGTGKQQSVTISGGSALGKEDIERMMAEAQRLLPLDQQQG